MAVSSSPIATKRRSPYTTGGAVKPLVGSVHATSPVDATSARNSVLPGTITRSGDAANAPAISTFAFQSSPPSASRRALTPDSSGTNSRSPEDTGAPTGFAETSTVHLTSDGNNCDALDVVAGATACATRKTVDQIETNTLYNTF